jgi:guanylate kinase
MAPKIFNVSGPYAVGKDSLINAILERHPNKVKRVSTLTTRPVSPEADPSYTNVSDEQMVALAKDGRWSVNYQLSGLTAYATSLDEIESIISSGKIATLSVFAGPHGAGHLREIFGVDLFSLGVIPCHGGVEAQEAELARRITERNRDDPEALRERLANQRQPLEYVMENHAVGIRQGVLMPVFNAIVENSNLEQTTDSVLNLFGGVFQL